MGINLEKDNAKLLLIGAISGLSLLVLALVSVKVLNLISKDKIKTDPNRDTYYEKEVFRKPSDVGPINSSVSGQRKETVKLKIPIIMYHYVEYVKDDRDTIRKKMDIIPAVFEHQLKTLKEAGYKDYFVRDIPGIINGNNSFSEKKMVLTFDDGYEDFYTDAFPILKKYAMKSTIYIMYNFLGRKGYLSQNQIREMVGSGLVELGSHTLDHAYLKKANPVLAKKEIEENKARLEETFDLKVESFAYPYGAFTADTIVFVREAGYTAAVSVIPGVYQSDENLFYLSRIRAGVLGGGDAGKVLDGLNK